MIAIQLASGQTCQKAWRFFVFLAWGSAAILAVSGIGKRAVIALQLAPGGHGAQSPTTRMVDDREGIDNNTSVVQDCAI